MYCKSKELLDFWIIKFILSVYIYIRGISDVSVAVFNGFGCVFRLCKDFETSSIFVCVLSDMLYLCGCEECGISFGGYKRA